MNESSIELLARGVNKQQEEALLLDQTSERQQREDYIEMLKGKIKFLKTKLESSDIHIASLEETSEDWHEESDRANKNYYEFERTKIVCALLEYLDRLEEQIFLISELLKPDEPKYFIPEHSSLTKLRDSLEKRLCYDVPVSTFDNELKKSPGFSCKYKDSYNYKKTLSQMIRNDRSLGLKTREEEKKDYPQIVASDSRGGRRRRKTKKQKKLKKKTKRAVKSNKRRKTKRT